MVGDEGRGPVETQKRAAPVVVVAQAVPAAAPWIVRPAFDLFFLANLWWPLVGLAGWWLGETESWFGFWQVYFLTTPHRWLTLLLVLTDRDRRAGRGGWLLGIAAGSAIAVAGVAWSTGGLVCLALVDYLWNAWHFGSQHAGIARMYARKGGERASPAQTWGLRLLTFYASLRLAGWSTGWLEAADVGRWWLMVLDSSAACACLAALLLAMKNVEWQQTGRLAYVGSVAGIYLALLVAINAGQPLLVAGLVAASAAMHAVEYLAIVTFYAERRRTTGSAGLFRRMAGHWSLLLGLYVVVLGTMAFVTDQRLGLWWLGINLWGAFIHYAYDGMIWKLREARTSSALGVELPAAGVGT